MKKKILAVAAVMALVCGLAAGCGSSSEPAQDTQQNEVTESATEEITEAEAAEEEADAEEEKETTPKEEKKTESSDNGISPDFKEAMDEYEDIMNEYIEFIQDSDNMSDPEALSRYSELTQKQAEATEKFEAWEDEELSDAEMEYYLDVQNRINKKMLSAGVE